MTVLPALTAIANGTPNDATPVDGNFDLLAAHVNGELINRDGSLGMSGELTLSSSAPSGALVAASKGYVDGHVSTELADKVPVSVFERTTDIVLSTSVSVFDVAITPETESNDVDGWWSSGTTFTVPATGIYLLALEVDLNKDSSSGSYSLSVGVSADSGASTLFTAGKVTNTTSDTYMGGEVAFLRAAQTFQIMYSLTIFAGTQAITIQNVRLAIARVGLI